MFVKAKNCAVIFSIGACGYGLIEILWRGYTHWSMLGAGGCAFLGLSVLAERMKKAKLYFKSLLGCGLITGIEYIFGVVFNIVLKRNVWDYSDRPFNLNGQVCLLYSFFWFLLCLVFIPFAGRINRRLNS